MQKPLLLLIIVALSGCTWTKTFGDAPKPRLAPVHQHEGETRYVCANGLEVFARQENQGLRLRLGDQSALLAPHQDGGFFHERGLFRAPSYFNPPSFHYTDPYGKPHQLSCSQA